MRNWIKLVVKLSSVSINPCKLSIVKLIFDKISFIMEKKRILKQKIVCFTHFKVMAERLFVPILFCLDSSIIMLCSVQNDGLRIKLNTLIMPTTGIRINIVCIIFIVKSFNLSSCYYSYSGFVLSFSYLYMSRVSVFNTMLRLQGEAIASFHYFCRFNWLISVHNHTIDRKREVQQQQKKRHGICPQKLLI